MPSLLIQRRLRWLAHAHRMEPDCLPREIHYGELRQGVRRVGRPLLRFTAFYNNSQSNEDMSEYSNHQEFYFRPVTEQETLKIVKALPSNKAPGADKVTARILKASLPVTLPLLTNLINCSFRSSIFCRIVEIDRSSTLHQGLRG